MRRKLWINVTLTLSGLLVLPGCHVLVRLGEPPSEQEPAEQIERPSPPSSGPETPSPPLPGLDESRVERPESRATAAPEQAQPSTLDPRHSTRSSRLSALRSRLSSNTGINTNTAIAPGEGQFVYRTQLRFLESHSSPGPADIDVNVLVNPQVLAYGVRENFTVFGVVPLVLREGTARPAAGGFSDLDAQGIADMRFFGKYRFWEQDSPGETYRWSVFGGIEVPTYDKDFSSDSWDPFIGTVWTYQSLEWGVDLDWFWNFNTGEGVFRHDEMRYDFAYTYVLLTGQTLDEKFWQLNSVFELNGSYFTDGSHLLYAAPGFQLALERMIVEASLQLPVIRDLKSTVEPDFLFAIGTRITW
ncbi:MAG: transporter [Planctomycetes bacterium]|nr:transporter [Planctomycetota bacterium]